MSLAVTPHPASAVIVNVVVPVLFTVNVTEFVYPSHPVSSELATVRMSGSSLYNNHDAHAFVKYTVTVSPTVPVVSLNASLMVMLTLAVNVAVILRFPVTVAGTSPQLENSQLLFAVAVTTTASSPVPIVNVLPLTLIAVPYGTSVTLLSSTVQ